MNVPASVENCEPYKPQSYRVQLCRSVVLADGWAMPITKMQIVNARLTITDDPEAGPREWNCASMTVGDWTVVCPMLPILDDSPIVREPMSDDDVERFERMYFDKAEVSVEDIIRAVEAHHGIGREDGK